VHGFVKGRSTLTNAAQHLNKACVLRVDLQEFFPSIDSARVSVALQGQGLEPDAVKLFTRIVTISGCLPIGLSTSPLISNIVFENADYTLASYCKSEGLTFTRYVDDMVFSGDVVDRNLHDIKGILLANGWLVNDRKTILCGEVGHSMLQACS
jgi:RNA-directed DNA polymerase